MAELLRRVKVEDTRRKDYIYKLLSAFPVEMEATQSRGSGESSLFSPPLPRSPAPLLVEPLSLRELELLRLVAAGLTNQEIAQKLFLAIGTVKKHLNNIFGKLGTQNRTQAIVRARDLDLL